jgi:hypothetical protein
MSENQRLRIQAFLSIGEYLREMLLNIKEEPLFFATLEVLIRVSKQAEVGNSDLIETLKKSLPSSESNYDLNL